MTKGKKKSPNRKPAPKPKAKSTVVGVNIAIKHEAPTMPPAYSNHFVVQHEKSVFHLLFYQFDPPILLGDVDLKNLDAIQARCVARVLVPADQIPLIIKALESNSQKHQQHTAGDGKGVIVIDAVSRPSE